MAMNVLCTVKQFVYQYRWDLLFTAIAVVSGYAMGWHFCALHHGGKSADDEPATASVAYTALTKTDDGYVQLPAGNWMTIQMKIAEIADNVRELRAYTGRLIDDPRRPMISADE